MCVGAAEYSDNCCSAQNPCPIGGGHCDDDADCMHDLVCGKNNCQYFDHATPKSGNCCEDVSMDIFDYMGKSNIVHHLDQYFTSHSGKLNVIKIKILKMKIILYNVIFSFTVYFRRRQDVEAIHVPTNAVQLHNRVLLVAVTVTTMTSVSQALCVANTIVKKNLIWELVIVGIAALFGIRELLVMGIIISNVLFNSLTYIRGGLKSYSTFL